MTVNLERVREICDSEVVDLYIDRLLSEQGRDQLSQNGHIEASVGDAETALNYATVLSGRGSADAPGAEDTYQQHRMRLGGQVVAASIDILRRSEESFYTTEHVLAYCSEGAADYVLNAPYDDQLEMTRDTRVRDLLGRAAMNFESHLALAGRNGDYLSLPLEIPQLRDLAPGLSRAACAAIPAAGYGGSQAAEPSTSQVASMTSNSRLERIGNALRRVTGRATGSSAQHPDIDAQGTLTTGATPGQENLPGLRNLASPEVTERYINALDLQGQIQLVNDPRVSDSMFTVGARHLELHEQTKIRTAALDHHPGSLSPYRQPAAADRHDRPILPAYENRGHITFTEVRPSRDTGQPETVTLRYLTSEGERSMREREEARRRVGFGNTTLERDAFVQSLRQGRATSATHIDRARQEADAATRGLDSAVIAVTRDIWARADQNRQFVANSRLQKRGHGPGPGGAGSSFAYQGPGRTQGSSMGR
ncbi:hypothetical protein ABT336_16930 [Micromonospora sp. NPDC000207]|uniref:hypothetical protein n=1 Tax=Micromonospora sp. NPDC000207 TaxID=3154246 RepID=UPI00332D7F0E